MGSKGSALLVSCCIKLQNNHKKIHVIAHFVHGKILGHLWINEKLCVDHLNKGFVRIQVCKIKKMWIEKS